MKSVNWYVIPVLIALVATGCAASAKKTPPSATDLQNQRIGALSEQVDRTAASVRDTQNQINDLARRLSELENKINTTTADQTASVQEIKDTIAFMNDQILRLDSSMRAPRAVTPRPAAPSAFKPGGFDASVSYKGALDEYYARRYESAITGFTELLTVAPNHDLADNAQYWIGECYFSMNSYSKALEAFTKVFDFPKSNKLADAHYKVAMTQLKLGNTDAAKQEFRAVTQNYPGTSAAQYSAENLSKLGE